MSDLTRKELAAFVRETKRRSREGEQPLDVLAALLDPKPATAGPYSWQDPKPQDFGEIQVGDDVRNMGSASPRRVASIAWNTLMFANGIIGSVDLYRTISRPPFKPGDTVEHKTMGWRCQVGTVISDAFTPSMHETRWHCSEFRRVFCAKETI